MFVDDYRFYAVTPDGTRVKELYIPDGVSLDGNISSQIRWGGSLKVFGDLGVDWTKLRLAPVLVSNGVEIPLGVYIVRLASTKITDSPDGVDTPASEYSYSLFDRTLIPAEDYITDTFSVDQGAQITRIVRELLESTGERSVAITETDAVTRSAMVWPVGESGGVSKLRIINDLLDAVGYSALWVDRRGQYRVEPQRPPAQRPIVHFFDPGPNATHLAYWQCETDAKVHNQVVVLSPETGDKPGMRAVARNEDPSSPYSFQAQGRWITRVETGVEAASQEVLNAHAQRLLAAEGATGRKFERSAHVLDVELSDVVACGGRREVIEAISITCTPGQLARYVSREVKGGV